MLTEEIGTQSLEDKTNWEYDDVYNGEVRTHYNGCIVFEEDIEYIIDCLTKPVSNRLNGGVEPIYTKEEFNVEKFINTNIKKIVNICRDTIDKMWKNIMVYVEEG